ncbi:MAG: hypothetical protein JST04_10055 [Bdellovibrionales bacterium]|nr:hypothetical protein [Bdellovibrionales bacterium]
MTEPSLVESLHLALKSGGADYLYRQTTSLEESKEIVLRSTRVALLVNCATKEDIAEIYPALAAFENRISEGTVKVMLLNTARHPKLREIVRARVGVEVVDLPVTVKALQYKLKNALMSAHQNYLKVADVVDTSIVVGAEAKTSLRTKPNVSGTNVLWQPPTEFDCDFWWIPDGKSIRLVVGVWLVDLIGPSPAAGTWEPVAGMFGEEGERAWAWRSRWLADEVFQTREGRWIFFGKQAPEFSGVKNAWCFMGKFPRLAYFPNGTAKAKYTRFEFRTEDGFLASENSATGKTLLPAIQATFAQVPSGPARPTEVDAVSVLADAYDDFELPPIVATDVTPTNLITGESSDKTSDPTATGPLVPRTEVGVHLGLGAVANPGVTAGKQSFSKMSLGVDVVRKNGELGDADIKSPTVYHVSKTAATILIEPPNAEVGDRFHFRFKFGTGDALTECLMEWEMTEIEMAFEQKLLARGEFVSGDLAPLAHLLDKVEERKRELREFYVAARG